MDKSKRTQIIEIVVKAAISVASVLLGISLESVFSVSNLLNLL